MNEIRTLFEQFWICRDTDRESYYKVKRDIPKFQRFVREQLGWKLVHTGASAEAGKETSSCRAVYRRSRNLQTSEITVFCALC